MLTNTNLMLTKEAARALGLRLGAFYARAKSRGIEPQWFGPLQLWTPEQIDDIGRKRKTRVKAPKV